MNLTLARQAVRVFPKHEFVNKTTTNYLRREWIKKITLLGDNWLFAKSNYISKRH